MEQLILNIENPAVLPVLRALFELMDGVSIAEEIEESDTDSEYVFSVTLPEKDLDFFHSLTRRMGWRTELLNE